MSPTPNLESFFNLPQYYHKLKKQKKLNSMEPATVFSFSIGVIVIVVTAYAVYTSFGPPGKELRDPFDEHED